MSEKRLRFPNLRRAVTNAADAAAARFVRPAIDKAALRDRPVAEQVETVLRKSMLEDWFPRVIDARGAGYIENFDRAWRPTGDAYKSLIYQSRIAWTAAAYSQFAPGHSTDFGRYARIGIDFIDRSFRDREQGGLFHAVDRSGEPLRGGEKHTATIGYVIFAAARVYMATRYEKARTLAQDAFQWIDEHAHDEAGGYHEDLRRDGAPISSLDDAPAERNLRWVPYGRRSMSGYIHLLETFSELQSACPDEIVRARTAEMLAIVRDSVVNADGDLLKNVDTGAGNAELVPSGGYAVETAWFLVEAAEVLGNGDDESVWRVAKRLVDRTSEKYGDEQNGGISYVSRRDGQRKKAWWAQAENLRALALFDDRYGGETSEYGRAFEKQWRFIFEYFLDARYGGWYRLTSADGRVLGPRLKANDWTACYHTGRALMDVSKILRARRGN